jgi:outer membrane protein TolC
VGNWSKLKQTQLQLAQSTAHMNWVRAQYAANQAQASLIKTLKLSGQYASVVLPDSLPVVPAQLVPDSDWQKRAVAIQAQLPHSESLRNRANTQYALAAYQASHALVQASREVVTVREFINEETVLHYNGMLSSVWDLLDESRNQSQAAVDVIGAQRDYWIAEADLQWVLQGGEPDSFVSLGGGGEASAPAAH